MEKVFNRVMVVLASFIAIAAYFLGSIGIGQNPPVQINVSDAYGKPLEGVAVQYADDEILLIGTTDKTGSVLWQNQEYGKQIIKLIIPYQVIAQQPAAGYTTREYTVNISRFKNEPIYITLEPIDLSSIFGVAS